MLKIGRLKPEFIILGVQKGGTTSLHDYVSQHKDIIPPKSKELHFFDSNKTLNLNTYHENFPFGVFLEKKHLNQHLDIYTIRVLPKG